MANVNDKPFLCEPGNLGLILNFDFFQPFDHLTYSLGAIYMSVLNLPRDKRYKQENTVLSSCKSQEICTISTSGINLKDAIC